MELSLVPLVGRVVSLGMLEAFMCLSWEVFRQSVCWLVGLCSHLVCLAWAFWSLMPAGCSWVGPAFSKMAASRGAHVSGYSLGPLFQCPPHSEPQLTPAFPGGGLQDPQIGLAKILTEFLLCPGTWCTWKLCAPCDSGVYVSPSPMDLLHSNPTGLQCQVFWGLILPMLDPQPGEPDMGFGTLTHVREPL